MKVVNWQISRHQLLPVTGTLIGWQPLKYLLCVVALAFNGCAGLPYDESPPTPFISGKEVSPPMGCQDARQRSVTAC